MENVGESKIKWLKELAEKGPTALLLLQEINPTYHSCIEWDGMVICDTDPEFKCCLCFKKQMKTRTDLLNHLAEKYQLKRYLEIGVQNPEQNFNKINCEYKLSVDPDPSSGATFIMTSDIFFNRYTVHPAGIAWPSKTVFQPIDLCFIDGLHHAEQVRKDFENALKVLSPKGFIVLHDCNPEKEEHTIVPRPTERGHWNGDVYKFASELGWYYKKFKTVDIDNGCGVWNNAESNILKDTDGYPFSPDKSVFQNFSDFKKQLLNLISWDEFISIGSHV